MKTVAFFVIGLVLMIPGLTGCLDIVWWFYTGHSLSSLEWDSMRPVIAYGLGAGGFLLWMNAA